MKTSLRKEVKRMALFLGVHKIPAGMQERDIIEGFANYKKSAAASGINALSAVYSMEKGLAYCQTEASSAGEVRKAHEDVQNPLEDVIEVKPLK